MLELPNLENEPYKKEREEEEEKERERRKRERNFFDHVRNTIRGDAISG